MQKSCQNCCNNECHKKIRAKLCRAYIPPDPLRVAIIEIAMARELLQFGEIRNIHQALNKRRLNS